MNIRLFSTFLALILISILSLPNAFPQAYTQWELPDGAIARFGKGGIAKIKYSQDGTRLAVASGIGVWIYDTSTYEEIDLLTGHTSGVKAVAFSPDGGTIATASANNNVHLWDAHTGKYQKTLTGHRNSVNSVAFSPDGKTLASGSLDGTVLLWELAPSTSKN